MTLTLKNQQARRVLIHANGLGCAPTGPLDLPALIHDLGYVQIDTIRNVTRAHHHILWSRNQNYKEPMLWDALRSRHLFEHFTHDASLLHMSFYPLWEWQFGRMRERFEKGQRWNMDADMCAQVKERIAKDGPLSTHAFDTKVTGEKAMWQRPPHKRALDYLWYIGELTTSNRVNFIKYYDLPERVIQPIINHKHVKKSVYFHKLVQESLKRLVVATPGELQDFWGAASAAEIKDWLAANPDEYIPIQIETHDRKFIDAVALPDIKDRLSAMKEPTSRLRILSPFDPLIRNRKRLERVFGFDYRIEIFVPAAKRRWGYYVYPILEGSKIIGRIELSGDRKAGLLSIANLWPEPGTIWSAARMKKLHAELTRFGRLAGLRFQP